MREVVTMEIYLFTVRCNFLATLESQEKVTINFQLGPRDEATKTWLLYCQVLKNV